VQHLIDAGVSCNACVSISFSDAEGIKFVEKKVDSMYLCIIRSLEFEKIKLFPKVGKRLIAEGLKANQGISCAT
jgi:hypothetical protein